MATAEGCEILLRNGTMFKWWQAWRVRGGNRWRRGQILTAVMPARAGTPLWDAKAGPRLSLG